MDQNHTLKACIRKAAIYGKASLTLVGQLALITGSVVGVSVVNAAKASVAAGVDVSEDGLLRPEEESGSPTIEEIVFIFQEK